MSSHFTVVYDACVLYPAPLRDLLMHLALSGAVGPVPGALERAHPLRVDAQRAEALEPYSLAAQHPDDFIVDLLDLQPASVLAVAARHRRSLKNPAKTAEEYLDTLLAQGLTQSAAVMRQWIVAL